MHHPPFFFESRPYLVCCCRYLAGSNEYVVADEDDAERRTRVGRKQIRRLEDSVGAGLQKGASVLAVFPDTTAFYRGHISKVRGGGPWARVVGWVLQSMGRSFFWSVGRW